MARLIERVNATLRGETPGAPAAELVGFRPTAIEIGEAIFELDAGPQHANPLGTLHGGVICDVADTAMGVAVNFVRPFWTGTLVATGRVVSSGRTIGLTECDVTDAGGRLIARATSTCMTLRGDSGEGR